MAAACPVARSIWLELAASRSEGRGKNGACLAQLPVFDGN
jgi:hypothetical protein